MRVFYCHVNLPEGINSRRQLQVAAMTRTMPCFKLSVQRLSQEEFVNAAGQNSKDGRKPTCAPCALSTSLNSVSRTARPTWRVATRQVRACARVDRGTVPSRSPTARDHGGRMSSGGTLRRRNGSQTRLDGSRKPAC